MVVARVGRVGARRRNDVGDLGEVAAPVGDGFTGGRNGEFDAVVEEYLAEFGDGGRVGPVDEGVVDSADGGARVDASVFIYCQDLFESAKQV